MKVALALYFVISVSDVMYAAGSSVDFKTAPNTVTHLRTRDHGIEVKASDVGPVYSIKDSAGNTLFKDLTLEQLQANNPSIYQLVKDAISTNQKLDASLHR